MTNAEIKAELKRWHVYQWQIAEFIGWSEPELSRKFRHELSDNDKTLIVNAINEIAKK